MPVEDLVKGMLFGKHLLTMKRNFLPKLALTCEFQGGLYHVMWQAFLQFCVFVCLRGCLMGRR